jgi:hypothetical protein
LRRERDRPPDEAGKPMAVMLACFTLAITVPVAVASVAVWEMAPGFQDGGLDGRGWMTLGIYAGAVATLCTISVATAWWLRRRLPNERRFAAAKWVRVALLAGAGSFVFAAIWIGARAVRAARAPAVHMEQLTEAEVRAAALQGEPGLRVRALNWGEQWDSPWLGEAMFAALTAESPRVRRRGLHLYWGLDWLTSLRGAFDVYRDTGRIAAAIGALEHDGAVQRDVILLLKRQLDEQHAGLDHVVKMIRWVGEHGRDPVPSRNRVRVCEGILWCAARDLHHPQVFAAFEELLRIDDLHDECHTWASNCLTEQARRNERAAAGGEGK